MGDLDPHTLDVYVDLETKPARKVQPWWPDVPPELPFYEAWLETGASKQGRPTVRSPEEIKVGRRKPENAEAYRKEQLEADRRAQAAWDLGARDRYEALVNARDEKVETLRLETALDPFLGGTIGCIGFALGESGAPRVITPDNDPSLPEEPAEGERRQDREAIVQARMRLRRLEEYRLLKRLSQGIQRASAHGLPEGQSRVVRLIAWHGFGFDFMFLAKRAAYRARTPREHSDAAIPADVDDRGLDRDLVYLASLVWHDAPWRSNKLIDPRRVWASGDRWTKGRLVDVARFFGVELEEELVEMDHAGIPRLLNGTPGERALAYRLCMDDVRMLQGVHGAMLDLGVSS